MLSIAICDDNQIICNYIESIILKYREQSHREIELYVFYSGESLFSYCAQGNYFDLIFLDIELINMNGTDVGEKIRSELNNETTQIVYISGKASYAMDLFKTRPLNFLVKPIEEEKIVQEIEKVIKLSSIKNDFFVVKFGRTKIKLPLKNILYFESNGRKINLISTEQKYEFYGKLSKIKEQVNNVDFIPIHKSYLVNYLHIKQYHYEYVIMSNDALLYISQSHRNKVRELVLMHE